MIRKMTVRDLYEWAVEHGCVDFPIVLEGDEGSYFADMDRLAYDEQNEEVWVD